MANNRIKKNAVCRLITDLKDWQRNKHEFPFINASPTDDDIFEWHCNISSGSSDGRFKDVILHLILNFAHDYPMKPPTVKLCTYMKHPNVLGSFICLDMIRTQDQGKYRGWTPAYNITSILMQLQSFLFEESKVDQDYGHSIENNWDDYSYAQVLDHVQKFRCGKCSHTYDKPFPPLRGFNNNDDNQNTNNNENYGNNKVSACTTETKTQQEQNNGKNENGNIGQKRKKRKRRSKKKCGNSNNGNVQNLLLCYLDKFGSDVENLIIHYFDCRDLLRLRHVCKNLRKLVDTSNLIQKYELKCWFHRRSTMIRNNKDDNDDDNEEIRLCLGYGITPHFYNNNNSNFNNRSNFKRNNPNAQTLNNQLFGSDNIDDPDIITSIKNLIGDYPMLSSIDTTFDLLSSDAFDKFDIRKSVFNDTSFTHFIPLYLYDRHGKLSLDLMEKYIKKLYNNMNDDSYHPFLALYSVAIIMNSLITCVMERSDNDSNSISLHYSINILEAFLNYHHLLLAIYVKNRDQLKPIIQNQINSFFRNILNDDNDNSDDDNEYVVSFTEYPLGINVISDEYHRNCIVTSCTTGFSQDNVIPESEVIVINGVNYENDEFDDIIDAIKEHSDNVSHSNPLTITFRENLKRYRNKRNIPNFGVFYIYLLLWEPDANNNDLTWNDIAMELLDEDFTRQVKWVLQKYPRLLNSNNNKDNDNNNNNDNNKKIEKNRVTFTWQATETGRKLIMFRCFFLKHVCGWFNNNNNNNNSSMMISPQMKFEEYNKYFGRCQDVDLALKLQKYIKKMKKCNNYCKFFQMIDINFIGMKKLHKWLLKCMYESEKRMYHKPIYYEPLLRDIEEKRLQDEIKRKEKEREERIKQQKQRQRENARRRRESHEARTLAPMEREFMEEQRRVQQQMEIQKHHQYMYYNN